MSGSTRAFLVGLSFLVMAAEVQAQEDELVCKQCVHTTDIAGGAINPHKLGKASVTTNKLASGAVTTDKLSKNSVTSTKLKKNTVATKHIKNGAVTLDKVSPELSNSIGTFCAPGDTVVGKDIDGNFVCEPASSPITPVVTGSGIDGTGNIEFRCAEWSGDLCVRPQARVLATSCGSYQDVNMWHDMTAFNDPQSASCPSYCKAVTGDEAVVSCAAGIETATASPNGFVATSNLDTNAGCLANNDYRWRTGGAFQAVSPAPGGAAKFYDSSQIADYAALVHGPILSNFCQGCHSPHTGNEQPTHSDANIVDAFTASKFQMDLNNPALSNFVDRLANDTHNCWAPNCAAAAADMQAAIEAFAATIPTRSAGRQNIRFSTSGVGESRLNVQCNW